MKLSGNVSDNCRLEFGGNPGNCLNLGIFLRICYLCEICPFLVYM